VGSWRGICTWHGEERKNFEDQKLGGVKGISGKEGEKVDILKKRGVKQDIAGCGKTKGQKEDKKGGLSRFKNQPGVREPLAKFNAFTSNVGEG